MESSAQQVSNSPMTYDEYLEDLSYSDPNFDSSAYKLVYGDNLFAKIGNFFSGDKSRMERQYNRYVEAINKANEERALANARAYNEWYDSTKYQRLVADLKKAGLNPWLALNGSFGTESPSNATPSSAKGVEFSVKETKGSLAALLGALAKLIVG